MCTPDHRALGTVDGVAPTEVSRPRLPSRKPKLEVTATGGKQRAIEVDAAPTPVTGVITNMEGRLTGVTGGKANAGPRIIEGSIVDTEAEARAKQVLDFNRITLEVRTRLEKLLGEHIEDKEFSSALSDARENLEVATSPEDVEFLTAARVSLERAEVRKAALKVTEAKKPEATVTKPAAVKPTATEKVASGVSPEQVARIAKERAINGALNGQVRIAQTMGGKDFNTVVRPWRDDLTRKLAVACGMPFPSDRDLGNANMRGQILSQIREEVTKSIGQSNAARLLPHFIINAR